MKKSVKIGLILAICVIIATIFIVIDINDNTEKIIVAVEENPPYTYTTAPASAYFEENSANAAKSSASLKFQGFDIDVLNEVAKRAGLKVEYRDIPFSEMLEQMKQKLPQPTNFFQRYLAKKVEIDLAVGGISITDERKKFAEYTIPFATGGAGLVTLRSADINSPDALSGKTVGVELATTMEDQARMIPGIKIKIYRDQQSLLADLLKGAIDAMVIDRIAADFYIKEQKMNQLKTINIGADEQFAMLARKGNFKLIDKLNKVLAEMQQSGELKKIHDKWFNKTQP
ncbi:MAG: transporter substrate-binding domain-containing protein [Negativicutes bacterium]|jgi:ABC-type amino acid transport substrate-binding protein